MKKFILNPKYEPFLIPLFSIFAGLIVGGIIILLAGENPLSVYGEMFMGVFGSLKKIGDWLVASAPLILTGISVAFAYRAGLFNIGAEGQFIVGSFVGVTLAIILDLPAPIDPIVCIIGGVAAGAIWGMIPGMLKAFWGVHEVVVTIMMNFIALYTTNYLIQNWIPIKGNTNSKTDYINNNASIVMPRASEFLGVHNFNWGVILAIICVFVFWFIMEKTTLGYELKATGFNHFAAKYAGIKEKSRIILTMTIAGAFSGLAGVIYSIGMSDYLTTASTFRNFGFDGIAVALLGACKPIGVLWAGLLIGGLNVGAISASEVPTQIVDIVVALIILFTAMGGIVRLQLQRARDKQRIKEERDGSI